ncbi:follicle cell protein 3C-1 [Chelonus insularis]|uniref:follicle cell protein 3C-1 n=1 Tax=Chelonus insularis TaxID=460826 RepID=UPI00158E990B|nr:follicle cell protein 3C-1 [Chelonus insularis]
MMKQFGIIFLWIYLCCANENKTSSDVISSTVEPITEDSIDCTCGIFVSPSIKKSSKEPPKGEPTIIHEISGKFSCTTAGRKSCTHKCIDVIAKHMANSTAIICGALKRDCHKEKAYLFVKNCTDKWINTHLSGGREYCCKDNLPYKC